MERVCIFIDGSNLYHGLKSLLGRTDLDFARFIDWLVQDRTLVRTYYYNATVSAKHDPQRAASQQRFFASLSSIPYFTMRAMVEGPGLENNAFALATVSATGSVRIEGYGKQPDRKG